MNILREYTLAHIKQNKRNSIFIFIAILIGSALITTMCMFSYSQWQMEINSSKSRHGDWHASFAQPLNQEQLSYLAGHAKTEIALIQTDWKELQLTDTKRPYIVLSKLDANYWKQMPTVDTPLAGRLPQKPGEIIVSKAFLNENPQYTIGDTLILPSGSRSLVERKLPYNSIQVEGERFARSGDETVTIVGSMKVSSNSSYPSYYAYGFLDLKTPSTKDEYLTYVRLNHVSDVYKLMPSIAEGLRITPGEDNSYGIQYNEGLISLYGVKNPTNSGGMNSSSYVLMGALTMALVMAVFIIIIYNAFVVSTNNQIKQLGIWKSIGATPAQIRGMVLSESMLLACVAVPLGIVLGYGFMNGITRILYQMQASIEGLSMMKVEFTWWIAVVAALASFLTVLLSSWMPAKRLAKLMPIEAIRGSSRTVRTKRGKKVHKQKKQRKYGLVNRWFGFEGELALHAFRANKRSFRTTLISLTLFLTLIAGFQCFTTVWKLEQSHNLKADRFNISLMINMTEQPEARMMNELYALQADMDHILYRSSSNSILIDDQFISEALAAAGGIKDNANNTVTNLMQEDEGYRVYTDLIGMDEATFAHYAKQIGADVDQFADPAAHRVILVNNTRGNIAQFANKLNHLPIEYLNLQPEDTLQVEEKYDRNSTELTGDYQVTIDTITDQYYTRDVNSYPFDLELVVPMDTYQHIAANFAPERSLNNQRIFMKMNVPKEQIASTKEEINSILSNYLAPEDWRCTTLLDAEAENEKIAEMINLMVTSVAIFLGLVGVSGALSSIAGSLSARRREFAVLRSVGLTPSGLRKILLLESIYFGILPIVLSLPLLVILSGFMLSMVGSSISINLFITHIPYGQLALCILLIMGSVYLAYAIMGARTRKDNIVESIKDETA